MGQTRRKFTAEFKREAVRMVVDGGHKLTEVARDLDLRPDLLRRWKRKLEEDGGEAFPGHGRPKASDAEMLQLRRELARVREERDILKKAVAIFSGRRT